MNSDEQENVLIDIKLTSVKLRSCADPHIWAYTYICMYMCTYKYT